MDNNVDLTIEGELELEVLRCMCGDPDNIHPGEQCPQAQIVKLGTVEEWENNPLLRAAFNMGQRARQLRRNLKHG